MNGSASLQRAARGSVLNVAGAAVSAVSNFLLALVVARMADQSDAGLFFSATSLFLVVVSVSQLGTNTGLVYFISGARSRGQLASAHAYMRVAAPPVLALSVSLAAVMFVFARPIADVLSPDGEEEFANFLRVAAPFLPFASLLHLGLSGTRGFGTMVPYAGLDQVARPLIQLGGVALVLALGDVADLAWAWPIAFVPLSLFAWRWWGRLADRPGETPVEHASDVRRPFWAFSIPRALTTVTQVAMQRLDIVLVAALADLESAAVYTAATRFLVLGKFASQAVAMSVQPLLGESLAADDRGEAGSLYRSSTGWLILATWPMYLVLAVFGGTILQVFGDSYAESGGVVLTVLSITMLFATSCGMVDMVLTMGGRSVLSLTNAIIAFVAYVGIDIVLIPRLGLIGAAYGWAAAILVVNVLPLFQVRTTMGLDPFGVGTRNAIVISGVTFGLFPLAVVAAWGSSLVPMIVALAIATVAYVAAVARFRESLQIDVLVAALRNRGRKGKRATQRATDRDEAAATD